MFTAWRRKLSQNFLRDRKLVEKLFRQSSIDKKDVVIEIGAGEGIITRELLQKAKKVISLELDYFLYRELKQKLHAFENLELLHLNFLYFRLPKFPYKVFANIPFSIEGKIVRKLLFAKNPPEDCYVIVRDEFAKHICGVSRETQFSVLHKPWFGLNITHRFRRSDFIPKTKVKAAMVHFTRRKIPLFSAGEEQNYFSFIRQGFSGGGRITKNLRSFFGKRELQQLARKYTFSRDSRPSDLPFETWLFLYKYFRKSRTGTTT